MLILIAKPFSLFLVFPQRSWWFFCWSFVHVWVYHSIHLSKDDLSTGKSIVQAVLARYWYWITKVHFYSTLHVYMHVFCCLQWNCIICILLENTYKNGYQYILGINSCMLFVLGGRVSCRMTVRLLGGLGLWIVGRILEYTCT